MNIRYFNTSPEIIRWAILLYVRYPLSLRQVEELLAESRIDISHESVRRWWSRFGSEIARTLKGRRSSHSRWGWHIDEVFLRINGIQHYLWRAVDHEGEIINCIVTRKCDRHEAKTLLRKLLKRNGSPNRIVTD